MSSIDSPTASFWQRLFALRGRLSRRPYAIWIATITLPFFPIFWFLLPALYGPDPVPAPAFVVAAAIVTIADMILTWPRFALSVKRLHDSGLTGWIALPVFFPLLLQIVFVASVYLQSNIPPVPVPGLSTASQIAPLIVYGLLLVLCILPGAKGPNRYGTAARSQGTVADAF